MVALCLAILLLRCAPKSSEGHVEQLTDQAQMLQAVSCFWKSFLSYEHNLTAEAAADRDAVLRELSEDMEARIPVHTRDRIDEGLSHDAITNIENNKETQYIQSKTLKTIRKTIIVKQTLKT